MAEDPYRPFLNERSFIRLSLPVAPSDEKLDRADDGIVDLDYEKVNVQEQGLDDIIFRNERVTLQDLEDFNSNLMEMGEDIFSSDLFINSNPVVDGEITGIRARVRGRLLEGRINLEIPKSDSYRMRDIREAFWSERFDKSAVKVSSIEGKYILRPTLDNKFVLSSGGSASNPPILEELGVDFEDATYAAIVYGKEASDFNILG